MYQIMCDDEILYDLRTDDRKLINPTLSLELNKTGTLSFSKPISNKVKINKLKSVINVYKDNTLIFSGRALNDEQDFYCTGKISVEGELAYLLDSIVRPYNFENKSVKDIMQFLISNHNKQVEEKKRFRLGNITVEDVNGAEDSVYRSSTDYTKTFDVIEDKLIDKLGGYLQIRREGDLKYLDYLKECTHVNSQVIRFRKNLLDITQFTNAEDIVTALIPLGAKSDDEQYTTITSVNNNIDYIYDENAVALYGWIWGTNKWDDVTIPSNLLTKAKKYLKECVNLALTLELTAIDLNLLDVNIERIKVGDWIRVISEPHGLDKYFLVTKMNIDLANPNNTKIILGDTIKGLTDKNIKDKKSYSKIQSQVVNTKDKIVAVDKKVNNVSTKVNSNSKELRTQRNFIIMGV